MKLEERIMIGAERPRNGAAGLGQDASEHAAGRGAVQRAGVDAKADNPARVLIHDDHNPVCLENQRFASEEIQRPETVLRMPEKGQP